MGDKVFKAALKFASNYFVTYKMLEKPNDVVFSNDGIDL